MNRDIHTVIPPKITLPDAVLKHDGRRVAFDLFRLEASVARANAAAAADLVTLDVATDLSRHIATTVAAEAVQRGMTVISTSDLRSLVVEVLRRLDQDATANAYQNEARNAAMLLWRVRVAGPEMSADPTHSPPWDRRQLLESLRTAGVATDVAGAVAREVERRIVALKLERVSPALIHALALLTVPENAPGARNYAARRVAFNASANLPQFDRTSTALNPLPSGGDALEQFWLQCIHSPEVVDAVRNNFLAPDPYLYSEDQPSAVPPLPQDPPASSAQPFSANLLADSPERIAALAARLAAIKEYIAEESGGTPHDFPEALNVTLKSPAKEFYNPSERADAVTINLGGLVAREAIREIKRAVSRAGDLARLAAQTHREREDYFNRSPVRGKVLPVAVVGLWNASNSLAGEPFDAPDQNRASFSVAEKLCAALSDTLLALSSESGMNLVLVADAPDVAVKKLWRADREYYTRDGLALNESAAYAETFELALAPAQPGFADRFDFIKHVSPLFDEAPAVSFETALQPAASAAQWSELLCGLQQLGIARARIFPSGGPRAFSNLLRATRAYIEGFPLLDSLDDFGEPE